MENEKQEPFDYEKAEQKARTVPHPWCKSLYGQRWRFWPYAQRHIQLGFWRARWKGHPDEGRTPISKILKKRQRQKTLSKMISQAILKS